MEQRTKILMLAIMFMLITLKFQNSSLMLDTKDGDLSMSLVDCSNTFSLDKLNENFSKLGSMSSGLLYFTPLIGLMLSIFFHLIYSYFVPSHKYNLYITIYYCFMIILTLGMEYYELTQLDTSGKLKAGRGIFIDVFLLILSVLMYFLKSKVK